ncbi:MAG: hypothetical protein K2Y51_23685 [Gammaproteobacteria bacterium]|nr:hypothetical protein [Gammaproteobacteria bacterium]
MSLQDVLEAVETLAERVRSLGGVLRHGTVDSDDVAAFGSVRFDLGCEAQALARFVRDHSAVTKR